MILQPEIRDKLLLLRRKPRIKFKSIKFVKAFQGHSKPLWAMLAKRTFLSFQADIRRFESGRPLFLFKYTGSNTHEGSTSGRPLFLFKYAGSNTHEGSTSASLRVEPQVYDLAGVSPGRLSCLVLGGIHAGFDYEELHGLLSICELLLPLQFFS